MVKLTYVGTDLSKLSERELLDMYNHQSLNSISRTEINIELANRLDKLPKKL